MQSAPRPVFIIGAPRSGTSILTWCLGQHSNILPLEEGCWMGNLAVDLAVRYHEGCCRAERSQLSSLGVDRAVFFQEMGRAIDGLVRKHRTSLEGKCREAAQRDRSLAHHAFQVSRSSADSKARWVDGTPENSFHVQALTLLFPHARFIHIVRDAKDAVRSLMHFPARESVGVSTESDAYRYWLRTVQWCCVAEQELGRDASIRVLYSDLVRDPAAKLGELLAFSGEAYEPACSTPMATRINASPIPADALVDGTQPLADPAPLALELSDRLHSGRPVSDLLVGVPGVTEAFDARVDWLANLPKIVDERTNWALDLESQLTDCRALVDRLQANQHGSAKSEAPSTRRRSGWGAYKFW